MLFITASIALAILWITWRIIYNVFLHPLRSIPGPFWAKVTSQWLVLRDVTGDRTSTIHDLHQRYGPCVRVGPNEVSYSNVEVVKELYGQQTQFMKAAIYDAFVVQPAGIFSMRDKAAHGQRRRLLSHAFSQSSLLDTEPIIRSTVADLVSRILERLGQPTDMLLLFRLTAFDVVGELFLGQSFGGLGTLKTPALLEDIDRFFILGGIKSVYPWLPWLLQYTRIAALRPFFDAGQRIMAYGRTALEDYISRYGRDSGRRDLLTKIVSRKTAEEAPMSAVETHIEISNLVFAGTDTTSTTLTYLFWELARHPKWQIRLRQELSPMSKVWDSGLASFKDIAELPMLEAVINEALRLHPAAPASLPRETPAGGRTLNGVHIPAKTVVSMQCYTTHRDPQFFPNPDLFLPERWLGEPGDAMSPQAKAMYMPFSSGPRACLGKTLAMMELKLITATLVRRFQVRPAPETTEQSMAMKDHFIAVPKSGKCELIFSEAAPS